MNVLLINSAIHLDDEIHRELAKRGHRVLRGDFNVGDPTRTLKKILSEQPADFKPDVVVCWSLDYVGAPLDVEEAEAHTVVQINDFHLAYSNLRPHLKRFDTIWTDPLGAQIFPKAGFESFVTTPLYSYAAGVPQISVPEKDFDVVFVGGMNHAVHQERSFWLRRLGRLASKYKVHITGGIFGEEYFRTLARGKIVFNHNVRREMNMRCFEAPALDCLVLTEKENLQVREFFPEGEAAVFYDVHDFEDKIEHYLQHPEERLRILENSKRIAMQMRKDQIFQFIDKIVTMAPPDRARRAYRDSRPERKLVASAANAVYAWRPEVEQRVSALLQEALSLAPGDPEALCDLAFTRLLHAGRMKDDKERVSSIKAALEDLRQAAKSESAHIPSKISFANLCLDLRQDEDARKAYLECRELTLRDDLKEQDFEGLSYPVHFDYFRMARERILLNSIDNPASGIKEQRLLFRLKACEGLGILAARRGDMEESVSWLAEAYECSEPLDDPHPLLFFNFAHVSWLLGDEDASIAYGERFDQLAPFEHGFWETHLKRILSARRFADAERKAEEYLSICRAFPPAQEHLEFFQGILGNLQACPDAFSHWEKAMELSRENQHEKADQSFRQARALLPQLAPLALDHGLLLLQRLRPEEALACFDLARADSACEAIALEKSAEALTAMGKAGEASLYIQKLQALAFH